MQFLSRLETRLVIIITTIALASMALGFALLSREIASDVFGVEERSLEAQARDWSRYVVRMPNGDVSFDPPTPPPETVDAPYTGVLEGDRPVYGFAIHSLSGDVIKRSEKLVSSIMLPVPPLQTVEIYTETDLVTGAELLIATIQINDPDLVFQVTRRRDSRAAIANTFFSQASEEFAWVVIVSILCVVAAAIAAIRVSFAGVRNLAASARRIDLTNLKTDRLSDKKAPAELVGLISAFNKMLDRLDAGVSAQRDFSINAAHELRTPLAEMRVRLDGAIDQDDLRSLCKNVDHMGRLVTQLLAIARLDGQSVLELDVLDLNEIAERLFEEFGMSLQRSKRNFLLENRDSPRPNLIMGNETLIELLLRNIVENVIKHTPIETTLKVTVEKHCLRLADDGPGVEEADLRKLFDRFYQGGARSREGTGLGLAIGLTAVERLNGSIEVRNSSLGGLEFEVMFQPAAFQTN